MAEKPKKRAIIRGLNAVIVFVIDGWLIGIGLGGEMREKYILIFWSFIQRQFKEVERTRGR